MTPASAAAAAAVPAMTPRARYRAETERIAAERGEDIGGTVGYKIRLESKAKANTRLLFCTTGILLKRLEEDVDLENVTHVFIDEASQAMQPETLVVRVLVAPHRHQLVAEAAPPTPCRVAVEADMLTEIYLCRACSYHEIEDGHARAGPPWTKASPEKPLCACIALALVLASR